MTYHEFEQHLSYLQQKEFDIRRDPIGVDRGERMFQYLSHTPTDVEIQHVATLKKFVLPLSLISAIIPGTLRLAGKPIVIMDYYRE